MANEYQHQWKAYFKRGEGEALVYANSEAEARNAALAAYRKKKTQVDFCTASQVVEAVEYIA